MITTNNEVIYSIIDQIIKPGTAIIYRDIQCRNSYRTTS
jgi:hypothetical protein